MSNEGFSSVVRITNIDDFILPSQACILPLQQSSESFVHIHRRIEKSSAQTARANHERVRVRLSDCLACSGCITSAETVLIKEQSLPKFLEGLNNAQLAVVTLSPQSLVSISYQQRCHWSETAVQITRVLKSLGVKYVLDSSFGRLITLATSFDEFKARRIHDRPVFTGVCPGFVCYAEKSHGSLLVPHISRVRSPQAIMGALVKDYLARKLAISPEDIFHAAVMPCYDKKLEAYRPDFGGECREVDCVMSSVELIELLEKHKEAETELAETNTVNWLNALENGQVMGTAGSSSGGYADYIVRKFVQEQQRPMYINKTMKNKDLETFEVHDGVDTLLEVVKCYGLKNIQNTVQKLRSSKFSADYVEIMACPSGCINGGGQFRAGSSEERKTILEAIHLPEFSEIDDKMENEMEAVRAEWASLNPTWTDLLYTNYHAFEKGKVSKIQTDW